MMKNPKYKTELLGKDNKGSPWYVLTDESYLVSENNVSFYVFPEKNLGKDIRFEINHTIYAYLHLIPPNECILFDIAHIEYDTSYQENGDAYYRPKSLFDELFDDERVFIENMENRGLGTLLLNRVESWAAQNDYKIIKGSINQSDNIDKLKHFYKKSGWVMEIPGKTYKLPDYVVKGIGIVYKHINV